MAKIVPQVGDVVMWADPNTYTEYTPPPPYVVVEIHSSDRLAFMRALDGSAISFGCGDHRGVELHNLRVDLFLTAARKANLEDHSGEI